MALQKSKTLDSGATGSYWKVTKASIDKQRMTLSCSIELFLDSDHSDKSSLGCAKSFTLSTTKEELSSDVIALSYTKIKALSDSDLSGATDC